MSTQDAAIDVREIIDLPSQDLLDFHMVLGKCFPEDELLAITTFEQGLRDDSFDIMVAVVGGAVVGGIVGEWHAPSRVYLGSYVGVLEDHRNSGVADALIARLKVRWGSSDRGPVLVLAEVEDPRFFDDAGPHGDPAKRLELYRRHGARMLDLRYTLPALERGLDPVPNLRLLAFPLEGNELTDTFVDVEPLRAWFQAYVCRCGGEPTCGPTRLVELIPELASDKRIPLLELPRYKNM